MAESYMREQYENAGIDILVPTSEQQQQVDKIIFDELVLNVVNESSKRIYIEICESLVEQGAQGVILGCTEIFLLIQPEDFTDLPLFNTTELHVNAIVEMALSWYLKTARDTLKRFTGVTTTN